MVLLTFFAPKHWTKVSDGEQTISIFGKVGIVNVSLITHAFAFFGVGGVVTDMKYLPALNAA